MKIIYLHQYFNTPEMSGGTRSYEMARRLAAAGHQVHMITSWRNADSRKTWFESEEAGIHVHWLPVEYSNHMSFKARIKAFFRFAIAAGKKAASLQGDVIFATSTPLTIALPGVYAAKKLNVPMVFEVRDLWPELPIAIGALKNPLLQFAARWLERFAYHHSAEIIALSPGMKKGVVKTGFPENKVHVIPNSSDLDLFNPTQADSFTFRQQYPEIGQRPLVVYTGTFGAINGVGYAVDLAVECQKINPEVRFVLIGDGAERSKVEIKARDAGILDKNLFIHDPVSKRHMPSILAGANIALSLFIDLKPMWTNSANKFFDGLASGTPMAINYGGWQAEMLQNEHAGLVLSPDNLALAAQQLCDFLAKPAELKAAGEAARNLAERSFSRDLLAQQLEAVLLKACGKSNHV